MIRTETLSNDEKPEYPKLMINNSGHYIALFYQEKCATIVHEYKHIHGVGSFHDNFLMMHFNDFDGKVVLENIK